MNLPTNNSVRKNAIPQLPRWLSGKHASNDASSVDAKHNSKGARETLDQQSFHWLAALVLLAQLPHYAHLPLWVSICGSAVVAIWMFAYRNPQGRLYRGVHRSHVLAIVALLGGAAVRLHYGYFLGRDPCVAMLFLLTACKFAETRHTKDASLLISLCGFLLLTQYFYSQTIMAALATLPAVVSLGGALQAITTRRHQPPPLIIVKSIAKLLLQGMPIAIALFVLFPRLPGPLWNLPADSQAQTGLSDSMTPGAISQLSQSSAVAFRVEFEEAIPPPQQRYWRGPILPRFDGRTWSAARRLQPLLNPPVASSGTNDSIAYTVTQQPNQQHWIFALEQATSLPLAPGQSKPGSTNNSYAPSPGQLPFRARFTADHQLITAKPLTRAVRYSMESRPSATLQTSQTPAPGLTQIAGRNTETVRFALQQRQQSSSDLNYANRLLQWFNQEPFHYTLKPSLLGSAPVDEFLFSTRRGFCEHYASAFTLMMRAAGIPSRVVTGYLGGEMNGDYMIVRQSDAHAWSEAWIDGAWQRFDPTAAVSPSRVEQGIASMGSSEPVPALARRGAGVLRQWQLKWDSVNHSWHRMVVEFDSASQNSLWKRTGLGKPSALHLVLATLTIAAIWSLAMLYRLKPARPKQTAAAKLWSTICSDFANLGVPIGRTEGPRYYSQRLQSSWPQQAGEIATLLDGIEQLRFGKSSENPSERLLQQCKTQRSCLLETLQPVAPPLTTVTS